MTTFIAGDAKNPAVGLGLSKEQLAEIQDGGEPKGINLRDVDPSLPDLTVVIFFENGGQAIEALRQAGFIKANAKIRLL